jgi:hypothetical protein
MAENPLKLDELTARLSVEPQFVRELLSEMAAQVTKEYLTIGEVATRLSWEEKTVKNNMEAGIFQYFSPRGIRPRFKWSAIVRWLEETEKRTSEKAASEPTAAAVDAIPMARGYFLGQQHSRKIAIKGTTRQSPQCWCDSLKIILRARRKKDRTAWWVARSK